MTTKQMKKLKKELKIYRENGVKLCLDGKPSKPKQIARACMMAEEGSYMRDYIADDRGKISTVNFDYIRD